MNKIFGMPCVITSHKKRCKVSNYKLIDWLYKKIYGYKEEVVMPEGVSVICFDGKFYFRDEETFNQMIKAYEETLTHNIAPSPKVLHDKATSETQKELMDVLDKWSKIEN